MIIGLTGGIGSGKSTVEQLFIDLGVTVIDADKIAHELSEPGKAGYQAITEHFGAEVLQSNGHIDRRKLRERIFNNEVERSWLEATLHPLIRREMYERAKTVNAPYCILSIPLLTETMNFDHIDRVLVIDAPTSLQIERTSQRDGMTKAQVQKILDSQNSREERLAYADDVIVNDQTVDALREEVKLLHQCYMKIANKES